MGRNDIIELYGTLIKETDDAILIDFGDDEVWLPKSQVEDWPEEEGESADISLPFWLAMDKDLI